MSSSQNASKTIYLPFLFCFIAGLHDHVLAEIPNRSCSNKTYTADDQLPFQDSLKDLLDSLNSNAFQHKFYNTSSGNGSYRLYGLYMCLDFTTNQTCQTCIYSASQRIKSRCQNSKEAVVYEDKCQLRYSNENFFGTFDVTENKEEHNQQNVSGSTTQFRSTLDSTLLNVTRKAASDVSNKYGAGNKPYTDDENIFAVAQCTKDLSPAQCRSCLEVAISNVSSCCYFSSGARILSRSCYLRYETYDFYGNGLPKKGRRSVWKAMIFIIVSALLALAIFGSFMYCLRRKIGSQKKLHNILDNGANFLQHHFEASEDQKEYIDLATILAATDNFSDSNLIGQGGFGPVYKGILSDGREVAVKRLSSCSQQGSEEFTNEVLLIMKLQHKNLVRLLGFYVNEEEKLLVYEFMPNGGLDAFIFDETKRAQLNWSSRFHIISGIARGILYLHEDSRLRIIHRDLKASNVLLDSNMNPKISDFGMARIFVGSEVEANTCRLVGTYGYMAPEYAMEGLYSVKSDVFSFGVLLLETITGKRSAGFQQSKRGSSLIAYMDKGAVSAMLCFIVALSMLSSVHPNPLLKSCHLDDGKIDINTPFEQNLKKVIDSLIFEAPNSGYSYVSFGEEGSGKVYGQAQCRGDVNSTECKKCLEDARLEILKCKTQESIIWYELCQIHFSSISFNNLMVYGGVRPERNVYHRKDISDPDQLKKTLKKMERLTDKAAYHSNIMFATEEDSYSKTVTIYGLVQCTRDIPTCDCKLCLNSAWGDLIKYFHSQEGGIILSTSCNVRFETFRFYKSKGHKLKTWSIVVITFASLALATLICSCAVYLLQKKGSKQYEETSQSVMLHYSASATTITRTNQDDPLASTDELPLMDLATIRAATDEFSDSNKLGQGGFGSVYKGVLPDGKEVAVKRLSRKSWQGLDEFKNELVLIAKLQHRNLVRLLGCAMEEEEKLLVYEFMLNKSLDGFIFDSDKRSVLDWRTRFNIINGIARGLLYLHEDSRLKIIHRDLKPSNVLLDQEMVAKISDFGLARIFCEEQNTANTKRVVGTYGYMAPEYAMEGLFSVKSDVFSFGVILLETISGKRNNGSYVKENSQTLIRNAWTQWREGKELEFVDTLMMEMESCEVEEVMRCMHIGLLCVQEDPIERPTISSVAVQLGSGSIALPEPKQPGYSVARSILPIHQSCLTKSSVSALAVSSTASSSASPC
ncbi:hypothetical protein UlMin_011425 [Ulmus minor]